MVEHRHKRGRSTVVDEALLQIVKQILEQIQENQALI